ncbi:membrane protein insertase YidC [Peribacillus frigoritolerans]|uniref:membrane protein insertase YidC n=1 Tax=Peribacillus frigoritolerans TaxID=450367 RepID=UPI0023DAA86A|nr:membrane protein insertase YidC [Peribacillus frigoritolerans]MDF1998274.1 membrane protein insertase YidC [Peribacillus frigoritolerans]
MKKKNMFLIAVLFLATTLLTGCSAATSGPFHTALVNPMTKMLEFNADLFNGNYGLSIIMMTFLIRLVLLPLTAKQYKTQLSMKTKMNGLKPEMTEIQQKIKETKDPAKQKALQQEMMQLYQKHGVNPLNMGCLPLLIQMPILMGFYYAIQGSHEIATHSFLWYSLGQPNIAMAIIAGVIYYFQSVISVRQMPEEQQKQMKMMSLLSPAMILFISFSAPAALPLYWSIGGIFMIVQSIVLQRIYKKDHAAVPAANETVMKKS